MHALKGCERFDYVADSITRSKCLSAVEHVWMMVRYVDEAGFQIYGWIDAGESGALVDGCPSKSCEGEAV